MLEKELKKIGMRKIEKEDFCSINELGSYCLFLYLSSPIKIKKWIFRKGVYVYIGSAKNGLRKRLCRYLHLKKVFWHIDLLVSHPHISILWAYIGNVEEKEIAKKLTESYPYICGFGNGDDKENKSHLIYIPPITYITKYMEKKGKEEKAPVYKAINETKKDPFSRFLFVFLSSRTKDEKTLEITKRLLKEIKGWEDIQKMENKRLENILRGVAFHRVKAKALKKISAILKGKEVPKNKKDLLKLPLVGEKISDVFLSDVFSSPRIGVDTHVFRISREVIGINAKNEMEVKMKLEKIVPEKIKHRFNRACVGFGQTICKKNKKKCKICKIKDFCLYYCTNIHKER